MDETRADYRTSHAEEPSTEDGNVDFISWGPASIQVALARKSPFVESSHKVTRFMLANHTILHELFSRLLGQYDQLRKRNAFLDNYRKEPMFLENLDVFDDAGEVQDLVNAYWACERPDRASFGIGKDVTNGTGDEDGKELRMGGIGCR
uniref:Tubulin/FtsZ 2-layer sandwich domain-containing protein n=1 Tax=Proboscia inermis TaxID=420281 RepID=A0A7S0CFL5_9STRA|mmetsp:Transcript_45825/g.46306  ORF Transcript_45825/g.46306 Transcript_45825/m.46306 type:complete len:149 (+) Transcript_45825:212-658(+)|eukprot:CAMPEP_0171301546 /NCGR_PEP_ID=MMETSP0816-20121228/10751_1 /TAXON_ID=420281 /ORGANISM="Proboscia inermis, Strain CCAP1064/1" /LENGTH=148 /DNA_ID=CAMNT_0011779221 /DNA_START=161 /DNA_END=607 /DNA_ORIENTATION=+